MPENSKGENVSAKAIIEALLFVSQDPLPLDKIKQVCQRTEREIRELIEEIKEELSTPQRGLLLIENESGYQLGTKQELAFYIEKLFTEEQAGSPLSQAALETLSIIALKQPVTRMEIENIRGVKCEGVIENLLRNGFIRIAGRREGLGRPFLYATTDLFLQYFGLESLSDVENIKEEISGNFLAEKGETK